MGGVKVFKQHIQVPFKNENQYFHPLTHKKRQSHTSTGKGPWAPIEENTGCNADGPGEPGDQGGGTDFFPNRRNKGRAETKRKRDTSRAFLPRTERTQWGVGCRGQPVTGPGAYFGFLVSGHAEEGEKNTAMETLLHVSNLGGRGHPLVELPGNMVQVGVQALLQGLVEDDLSRATEESQDCHRHPRACGWTERGSRPWPTLQPQGTKKV